MRTPPFLLGACLLFWGWQSGFLPWAVVMALVLESSRYLNARWDLTDAEVSRIWNFCVLLGFAALVFAFTNDEGPSAFSKFLEKPDSQTSRQAGDASTQAAVTLLRSLPFIFYLFVMAQVFSSRREFPMETLSPFLRYRRKQLLKHHRPPPQYWQFNGCWPYFIVCLFAASAHAATVDRPFFSGLCMLLAWALWSERPPGFSRYLWVAAFVGVLLGSMAGQQGFGRLLRLTDWADNYNAAWLSQWLHPHSDPEESRTSIGHIGRMQLSSQIVLRVTPVNNATVPTYLREATYRTYSATNRAWFAAGGKNDPVAGKNDFSSVPEAADVAGHFTLQPGVASRSLVQISCYLEGTKNGFNTGILPLPVDCDHVEQCPAFAMRNNLIGTVMADGPGLLEFDAGYGSGHCGDSPPILQRTIQIVASNVVNAVTNTVTNIEVRVGEDLAVPAAERAALDTVIAQLPVGLNDVQKMIAVRRYFAANYKYGSWMETSRTVRTNLSALSDFLLNSHRGHCEYFATATVLLLREWHVPARYAVGYVVHEPAGRHYVVRLRDAHAWCLAWNARDHNWQTLDTTPASWVAEEGKRASPWQSVSDFFSWLGYQFAKFRSGQSHLRPWLMLALVPTLGYFLYQILFYRRRHKPQDAAKSRPAINWPGLDSEFYALEKALIRRGLVRRPGESAANWLRRVAGDPAVSAHREPLRQLVRLHYQHRFDPVGLNPVERTELTRQAKSCLAAIAGA